MTAAETLTLDGMLDAFGTAGRVLPRAALEQAAKRLPEVSPPLLALLAADAAGVDRSDRTSRILFFGIYLMAQVCETRAFRTICTIAADGERMTRLIGDGVTEDLACILARVYDGDQEPLRRLIESPGADQYARDAGIKALAWLTATSRIDRDETAQYLRELFTSLRPQATSFVWVGWQHAVACLALGELVPVVEEAFERGWIDRRPANFHRDLLAARQAGSANGGVRAARSEPRPPRRRRRSPVALGRLQAGREARAATGDRPSAATERPTRQRTRPRRGSQRSLPLRQRKEI